MKDDAKAVEWFQKVADQGHANAQFILGVSYQYGHGMPKDETKAVEWFQKAADQGHIEAQCAISEKQEELSKLERLEAQLMDFSPSSRNLMREEILRAAQAKFEQDQRMISANFLRAGAYNTAARLGAQSTLRTTMQRNVQADLLKYDEQYEREKFARQRALADTQMRLTQLRENLKGAAVERR